MMQVMPGGWGCIIGIAVGGFKGTNRKNGMKVEDVGKFLQKVAI